MTVISMFVRRVWVPIVRCEGCGNDRAETGPHPCQTATPAAPSATTREPLTTL